MSNDIVKIILIDSHRLFRAGIKRILEREEKFDVIAEGENVNDAARLMNLFDVDIVLIDISSNTQDGLSEIHRLIESFPSSTIVILSAQEEENLAIQALRIGAKGFLLKEMNVELFIDAINAIHAGNIWYHPNVLQQLLVNYVEMEKKLTTQSFASPDEVIRPLHLLTKRECEVLQLLSEGYSNEGIAKALDVAESTVKNHVASILRKMNVSDRTVAAITAIKNRWVYFEYNQQEDLLG